MATSRVEDEAKVVEAVVVEKRSDPSPVVARVAINPVVDVAVAAEATVVEKRLDLSPVVARVVVRVVIDPLVPVPMAVEDVVTLHLDRSLAPSHSRSKPQPL